MTGYRLTRRGRLVLHALPLFLTLSSAVAVAVDRLSTEEPPKGVAAGPAPVTRAPEPRPIVTRSPSPKPTRAATPSPTPTPRPAPVVTPTPPSYYGTGTLAVVPGTGPVRGTGPLRRYVVEVETGLGVPTAAFTAEVERVLGDPRGWRGSFQRVAGGPVAFRVVLASPATTDRLCRPLDTGGIYSCYMNGRAVLNAKRWVTGATAYGPDLAGYRVYMVNHEVGHAIGYGHRYACGAGGLAPVMLQQSKGLRGCRKNPWPLANER